MPAPPPLTIQLFGPMRALVHGEPIPRGRTRSVEWLLALLTLRHERAVERSWLAGTLWPDSQETQALHNLRDVLVHLRKATGRYENPRALHRILRVGASCRCGSKIQFHPGHCQRGHGAEFDHVVTVP